MTRLATIDLRVLPKCFLALPSLVFLLGLVSPPLWGQAVRGRLVDDETGDPIVAANLSLLAGAQGDEVIRRVLTDDDGRFHIDQGRQGRYRLRAERIGYEAVTSPPFDLVGQDTLEVELRASVQAVPLAPLTVISDRPALILSLRLENSGFRERENTWGRNGLGFGYFLERADWERRAPSRVSDILVDLPGVHVLGAGGRKQIIRMRSITSFSDPTGCTPMYYLDGAPLRFPGGESIDDLISAWSITAIEVYPGLAKPGEFMHMLDSACGAIVIWTGF